QFLGLGPAGARPARGASRRARGGGPVPGRGPSRPRAPRAICAAKGRAARGDELHRGGHAVPTQGLRGGPFDERAALRGRGRPEWRARRSSPASPAARSWTASTRTTTSRSYAKDGGLKIGWRVALAGLKSAGLNGQEGNVGENLPVHSPGRALVNLESGAAKAIKFENIVLVRQVVGGSATPGPRPATPGPVALGGAAAAAAAAAAKAGPEFDKSYDIGTKVSIIDFVDPGMNGESAVVLGQDALDKDRFQVRVDKSGMVMALKRTNLTPLGGKIEMDELEQMRTPLKDRFYAELRKLLWNQPEESIAIATLASETVAKHEGNNPFSPWSRMWQAWLAVRATYPTQPEMYDVLTEAPALFAHLEDQNGWGVVALTEKSRQMLISAKVPEPPTKKRKVGVENTKGKLDDMARAAYNALTMSGPKGTMVHISQVGSDVTVRNLRNDKWFGVGKKKRKLEDMLREYPKVFEIEMTNWGVMVKLTDEADVALPARKAGDCSVLGAGDVLPDPEQAKLPEKIQNPQNRLERAQAFRIELIHALHRHGGKTEIGIMGQEPSVQQARRGLEGTKSTKFVDLCRIFADNFSIYLDTNWNKWVIELDSKDVSDMTPINDWMKGKPSRAHIEARQTTHLLRAQWASAPGTAVTAPPPDDDVGNEEAEAAAEEDSMAVSQFFCHQCCSPVERAARFCSQCGSEMPADGWLNAGGEDGAAPGAAAIGPEPFPPLPPAQPAGVSWPKARGLVTPAGKLPGTGLPKAVARALKKSTAPDPGLPAPLQPGLIGKGAPLERKQQAVARDANGEIIYGAAPTSEMPDPWRDWRAQKRGDLPPSEMDPFAEFGIYPRPKPK
ncbi:unnamed protein product, partial [Prorocentrum cordatum]